MILLARILCIVIAACITGLAQADPTVPDGYSIENYATGIGAANGLAIGPDGLLYITDYRAGQLLRRTTSGALEVVASNMPNASGVAFSPSGRVFVVGGYSDVYEVVRGMRQVFATGFSSLTSIAAKGDDLYVSSSGNGTISKISTITGTVTTELTTGNPHGMSVDAVGNLYYINHAGGQLLAYNFVDPPRLVTNVTPLGGTYTGFGFSGQLFWGDYQLATLFRLTSSATPEAFATGFAGGAAPPAIGPNQMIAQGNDAILVADGHNVWRIALRPSAPGVLHERSMHLQQTRRGWALECAVTYAGIDRFHDHRVTLTAIGPGITATPLDAIVGPKHRSHVRRVRGVQDSEVQFNGNSLQMEYTVYFAAQPTRGTTYYCRGSGQDLITGGYLRATLLEDIAQ
jgi:hypothetical protein